MNLPALTTGRNPLADAATLTRNSKAGPTYYETLGVSPNATNEEISGAFARAMNGLMPRPVATIARLSVAYDTLRDPQKRRAYDASLKPAPKSSYALQWSQTPPKAPALALVDRLSRPAQSQQSADVAPFDAEPVREKLAPVPPAPEPEVTKPSSPAPAASIVRPEAPEAIDPRRHVLMMNDDRADWRASLREDQNAIDWKKVAVAVGWPVLGIAMIGAIAGLAVGMVAMDQPAPPDALKMALPPSEPSLDRADAALLEQPTTDDEQARTPRAAVTAARVPQVLPEPAATPQEVAEAAPDPLAPIAEPASASDQPAPQVASARMPLSNQTIARTIGRIGYSCGSVASVEGGASGVFKVTCTSGDTYRASPVRGRYHFRRMGRG